MHERSFRALAIRRDRFAWAALLLAVVVAASCRGGDAPSPGPCTPLALSTNDRILVLAPHPDDESIACGGVIQRARSLHIPVRVAFLTYGDNNEWSFLVYRRHAVVLPSAVRQMGLIRHDEAVQAGARLGLQPDALAFLGYPDFGTLRIWMQHWGRSPPLESMLTRVTQVPYTNAYRPGAEYRGEEIVRDLTSLLRDYRPTRIFVSHPADFNPDHRALYLFTRVTLWNLESELSPTIHPYLVHFPRWPLPRGLRPDLPLDAPELLSRHAAWQELRLSADEIQAKRDAVSLHRTQCEYAGEYLMSFVRNREIFGDLPAIACSPTGQTRVLTIGQRAGPEAGDPEGLLTEEERARFVGVECRRVQVDASFVTVSIELSRPLGEAVTADVKVFGYRRDVPFGRMPKLCVRIGHLEHKVLDQSADLAGSGVTVDRSPREIRVRVPLPALGSPTRLLVSARTQLGEVPLDWASWRILEIGDPGTGHRP